MTRRALRRRVRDVPAVVPSQVFTVPRGESPWMKTRDRAPTTAAR